ncbi:MAG: methyltransferase domain-containing protein [Candidatus Adiutrix intracellularis]|nr:methyltransferase domain-containing protein [Candidatus Adiutrix intracellularis]
MDLNFFENNWVPLKDSGGEANDFWNRRAASYNRHKENSLIGQHNQMVLARVAERCGLNQDSRILDIGCGPGQLSIDLAVLTGAAVTGLDLAPAMIELAKGRSKGVSGVDFQLLDWAGADIEALGWVKKFDLAMASRTPAICNRSTLEKMMVVSSGYGVLISGVDIHNSVREPLKEVLGDWDELKGRASRSIYNAWNLLWLMGYFPSVSYLDNAWEDEVTLEEAILIHLRYFEMAGPLSGKQRTFLIRALEKMARNGLVRERVRSRTVIVIWSIDPSRSTQ